VLIFRKAQFTPLLGIVILSMVTGEKPGSSRKKNEEMTPSKEADDKHKEHKEESAGSIKSH
jgi:hypothetical protein